jgi:peptidyl-prolyl cis-trans isomerase A (cyclophilin A)
MAGGGRWQAMRGMIYPRTCMRFTTNSLISTFAIAVTSIAALAQETQKPVQPALPDAPQATAAALIHPNGPTVVMDTSMGRITCQFFQKEAPKTVANFIALAEGTKDWTDPQTHQKMHNKSLYDGTIFHRVIPEFMIQGGDPIGAGTGDPGYTFEDEFNPDLNFDVPGRLAMANSGPNTNGSQFFITEVPTEHLNQKHTIFGQCDEPSINVVKAMARVQRDDSDKPVTPVVLKKVTIVPEGQAIPPDPAPASQPSTTPQP